MKKQVVPAANGENVWMVINIVYRQKRNLYNESYHSICCFTNCKYIMSVKCL